ncbi:hypothetical protein CEP54_000076 [Fusarium duplospermum]|uniref:Uncharacterized protein n=1 Tax=Fusarium duplospermum TaxID=1325734 RepID=A0A428R810_9HYPO|nr:hypothetical protein CEP54_000076 [Fusarium duplospermum]
MARLMLINFQTANTTREVPDMVRILDQTTTSRVPARLVSEIQMHIIEVGLGFDPTQYPTSKTHASVFVRWVWVSYHTLAFPWILLLDGFFLLLHTIKNMMNPSPNSCAYYYCPLGWFDDIHRLRSPSHSSTFIALSDPSHWSQLLDPFTSNDVTGHASNISAAVSKSNYDGLLSSCPNSNHRTKTHRPMQGDLAFRSPLPILLSHSSVSKT